MNNRLDVVPYEDRVDTLLNICDIGTKGDVISAAHRSADDVNELCAEVRRLQMIEDRVLELIDFKRQQMINDRAVAEEQGLSWLGLNSRTISANLLDSEIKNLEKVLGYGA